jgi:phage shock protein E
MSSPESADLILKMKTLLLVAFFSASPALVAEPIPNPLIDYRQFQKIVVNSAGEREAHRLTEPQFIKAMADKKAVLLDARSAAKYELRHIRGSVNLPFTDFTAESLANVIPAQDTKVLIYCNNNFEGSPVSFASKAPSASLNISTYTSLRSYGYTNVFELGPLLDVHTTSIPFAGTEIKQGDLPE